jgi:hypothetical protein
MPILSTKGGASASGYGGIGSGPKGGGLGFADASQNGQVHSSGGRIVLDGYGLLFYIGSSGTYNTWGAYESKTHAAKTYTLAPADHGGNILDITLIGGGGANVSGGGAGGSGGAGVRFWYTPTGTLTFYIGGGANTHYSTGRQSDQANNDYGATFCLHNGSQIAYAGNGGSSPSTPGGGYSANVPTVSYANGRSARGGWSGSGTGGQYSQASAVDTTYQVDYAGNGQVLGGPWQGNQATPGSGLGGGGGGQNSYQYGQLGSNPGNGGRYGYAGGIQGPNSEQQGQTTTYNPNNNQAGTYYGYGPSPGESNQHRNNTTQGGHNQGGGGGSFGAGGGEDGSGGNEYGAGGTGAGGAVLVRMDTPAGLFISGTPGWPSANGPWTG